MPLIALYHVTSKRAADSILTSGFVDVVDDDSGSLGVWFADRPIDWGVRGRGALVIVEVPAALLSDYEQPVGPIENWSNERRRWVLDTVEPPFRAFHLPASVVNLYGRRVEREEG